MKIIRPTSCFPSVEGHCIFLAGPTPRNACTKSWRPEAIEILKNLGYKGSVCVPEAEFREEGFDYMKQVEWEKAGLERSDLIVFWVPRELRTMPGFTTNVEFGRYVDTGKVLYGRPPWAAKCRYLDWLYYDAIREQPYEDLGELLHRVICIWGKNNGETNKVAGTSD